MSGPHETGAGGNGRQGDRPRERAAREAAVQDGGSDNAVVIVPVPLSQGPLEPPPLGRVRALKWHLVRSLRDLRLAKRPDRLIQKTTPEPVGFDAAVVAAGCATCQGHCCKGGGEHAYIDERTMARVRRDNPDLDAAKIIGLFLARLAPRGVRGSCLFHGPTGCTLGRPLRAELCNQYYCNGLRDFLRRDGPADQVRIVASRDGRQRRSAVLRRSSHPDLGEA